MENKMVQMIADKDELQWFFNHCIFPLQPYESYSMILVSRHKKLTAEEKDQYGLTRKESEFLKVETLRRPPFKDSNQPETNVTFDKFYRQLTKLNFDEDSYMTEKGFALPTKTLAIIFYVNPCNDIKVYDYVIAKMEAVRTGLIVAMANGKQADLECKQNFQAFGNLDNLVKHAKAQCKGSVYWMDYDIDVPIWWKRDVTNKYYLEMYKLFTDKFGRGNFVIVSTSGGYHVLVKTKCIHFNPHDICKGVDVIYAEGLVDGEVPYVDENNLVKYECIVNDANIPGIPLPGTYQYTRPVIVLNKEDF